MKTSFICRSLPKRISFSPPKCFAFLIPYRDKIVQIQNSWDFFFLVYCISQEPRKHKCGTIKIPPSSEVKSSNGYSFFKPIIHNLTIYQSLSSYQPIFFSFKKNSSRQIQLWTSKKKIWDTRQYPQNKNL